MSVRIIIDSSSDFELDVAAAHGITVIPMKTIFGEQEFAEGSTSRASSSTRSLSKPTTSPTRAR